MQSGWRGGGAQTGGQGPVKPGSGGSSEGGMYASTGGEHSGVGMTAGLMAAFVLICGGIPVIWLAARRRSIRRASE